MDRTLFYEIILFVEKKGFKDHLKMLPGLLPPNKTSLDDLCSKIFWQRRHEIIFNHEFCKAIASAFCSHNKLLPYVNGTFLDQCADCGEKTLIGGKYKRNWKELIMKMVTANDPFKYLEQEYKRIK